MNMTGVGKHRASWTEERREKLSHIHRTRHGAPDGHCTILGVHVPHEYGPVLRFMASRIRNREGADDARSFIQHQKDTGFPRIAEMTEIYNQALDVRERKEIVRRFQFEVARYANQNSR